MKGISGRASRRELRRRRRGINSSTELSLGRLLYVERGFYDTTQGTLGVGTEGRATFVSETALLARPVPPPVDVTWLSIHLSEMATSFDGIAEVGRRKVAFRARED